MKMRKARGLTLVEVLVALTLGILLLALLNQLLVPVLRTNSRLSVRVHLRQQATTTLNHLSRDLRSTSGGGLSYQPGPPLFLSVSPVSGLSSEGHPLHQSHLVLYRWSGEGGEVRRWQYDGTNPSTGLIFQPDRATLLSGVQIATLVSTEPFGRFLAGGVTEFKAFESWPPGPLNRATITLERKVGPNKVERLRVVEGVGFRNG